MNKYSYKGQVITASSKQMAIKKIIAGVSKKHIRKYEDFYEDAWGELYDIFNSNLGIKYNIENNKQLEEALYTFFNYGAKNGLVSYEFGEVAGEEIRAALKEFEDGCNKVEMSFGDNYINKPVRFIWKKPKARTDLLKRAEKKRKKEDIIQKTKELVQDKEYSEILKDEVLINALPEALTRTNLDVEDYISDMPKEILELRYKKPLKTADITTDTLATYLTCSVDDIGILPKYIFDITDKNGVSIPYAHLKGDCRMCHLDFIRERILNTVKATPKKAMLIKNNKGESAKDLAMKALRKFPKSCKEKKELETLLEAL